MERVLSEHPAVADVAVFGIPDEEFGEQVKAVVATEEGTEGGEDLAAALTEHCRRHLAGFKVPKSLDFRIYPGPPPANSRSVCCANRTGR